MFTGGGNRIQTMTEESYANKSPRKLTGTGGDII